MCRSYVSLVVAVVIVLLLCCFSPYKTFTDKLFVKSFGLFEVSTKRLSHLEVTEDL